MWATVSVATRTPPEVPKSLNKPYPHDPRVDRWLPAIYDSVSVQPSTSSAREVFEQAIDVYANGRGAEALPMFATVAAKKHEEDECFRRHLRPADVWCWKERGDNPTVALQSPGTRRSSPPIEATIYESKSGAIEALGPPGADETVRVVKKLAFERVGPRGEASLDIMGSSRRSARALVTALKPALDACLAGVP